ncbi:hypothetical protein QZH41_011101, partial [Actinostola sp. cb2023]
RRKERLKKKRRSSSSIPSGQAIIKPRIPTFTIPPIVPIPIQTPTTREIQPVVFSPPSDGSSRGNGGRRCSVLLDDIRTSVSMKGSPPSRKLGPSAISSTNEPAIANLYKQQKKAIAKKSRLKHSSTSSSLGKLEFSLFYDQNVQELQIYVVRGVQLYFPGSDGPASLVLKAVIVVDGEQVWQDKTKATEPSGDPDFSEQLIVHGLSVNRMRKGSLKLIVLDDKTGEAAGEVVYPLSSLPFNSFTTEVLKLTEIEMEDYVADRQDDDNSKYGELLISMCHNRNEKKLTVRVECAKCLPAMYRGSVDSFVKVEILFVGKKLCSGTTKVVSKNRDPEYDNENFDFVIPDDKLPQITIVFKVKHHGKMRDSPIGMVKLGYDADRETAYRHLEQVLDKPHLCIENWHAIQKYR